MEGHDCTDDTILFLASFMASIMAFSWRLIWRGIKLDILSRLVMGLDRKAPVTSLAALIPTSILELNFTPKLP